MDYSKYISEEDRNLIEYLAPIDSETRPQNAYFIEVFRGKIEDIIVKYKTVTGKREMPLDELFGQMCNMGDKDENLARMFKHMAYHSLTKVEDYIKTHR